MAFAGFQPSAFQNSAFEVDLTIGQTVLMPGGSVFSRDRWRKLLDDEQAQLDKARKAKQQKKQEKRELALAAAEKARQAVLAAREAQHSDWAEQGRIRQLTAALSTLGGANSLQDTLRHSHAMTDMAQVHHAHAMANDEDEAVTLLMLHG